MQIFNLLKDYSMVFRAGLRDPCTRDVARCSESVKRKAWIFDRIVRLANSFSNRTAQMVSLFNLFAVSLH